MASSRCYTRRIGWDPPNRPGSGKWTFTSPAPTFCVIGPALRTSTAKPTAFTAGCGLVQHSVSSPGTTGKVFSRRATHVFHARSGSAATTIWCSPKEPTFGTRATMGYGGLEKPVRVRRRMEYTWSDFGRPGADQAPSSPGALHDLNGGHTRFLEPAGPRSQRVLSGDPT